METPGSILINHAVRNQKQMKKARNHIIVSLACSDIVSLLISVALSTLNIGLALRHMPEAVYKAFLKWQQVAQARYPAAVRG